MITKDLLFYGFLALLAGSVIGLFYFGGLWWTVGRLVRSPRPALWSVTSFWIRTVVSVSVFYLVTGGHPERLLLALFGFMLVRIFMVRALKPAAVGVRNPKARM
jgi:F1F0 ATPase subunit 2